MDESQMNFKTQIKEEIKAAVDFQQSQMKSVIECSRRRNEYLEELSKFEGPEESDFPECPEHPPHELIEQYYESRRRYLLAGKNRDRLSQIQNQLSERIENAQSILEREQQEKNDRAIYALSPTVARLLGIQIPQNSSFMRNNNNGSNIEYTMLKDQLDAIADLKSGTSPRQYGEVKYDFDGEIDLLDREIKQIKSQNDLLLQEITTNINNFLQDSTAIQNELTQREKDVSSFQNFAKVYYNSINEIEKLKYTKLLQVMKAKRNDAQNERFDELITHLNQEREIIDKQLSSLGTSDFETIKLKSEIEFQMLYLGHLTAIAGKALSRISTENPPPDPVEEMRAEIIHMQHKLSKSNLT